MTVEDLYQLLEDAVRGAAGANERLVPAVYEQLRAMARRLVARDPVTVAPTALVHDAWLRLQRSSTVWSHRGHFFGAAARAMRRILVETARMRQARKRGGGDVGGGDGVDDLPIVLPDPAELLDLDAALSWLESNHPREAEVVSLRYFAGLSNDEVAAALGVSVGTVERDWRLARARLKRRLGGG